MITVEQELFVRPEEITEYFRDDLRNNASALGIEFVGAYGEKLLPSYPAVVVSAGDTEKEVHGTHTYIVTLRCNFFVYHASMNLTHASRSLEDLKLATTVVDFIERDPTLGDKIVHGFVISELPGISQLNSRKTDAVVSTRLSWQGISERRF